MVGAFLCARAEAIASVGPMDERFFLYSEEIDWCLRARQAGWDVRHLPVMTVTHHAGRRDRGDLMAQLAHSRSLFARKHHGCFGALGIHAALALGHLLRIAARLPLAPFKSSARGADRRRGEGARASCSGSASRRCGPQPLTRAPEFPATVLDEAR